MIQARIIPCLLLKGEGLVKGIRFANHKYVGDPRNAVRIYNEMEVDELIIVDILASVENRRPRLDLIREIVSEAFMPVAYGGGIKSVSDIREILALGVEKIIIETYAVDNPRLIREASNTFGSQSIVVCIDVKQNMFGKYFVYTNCGTKNTKMDPISFAVDAERMGAGELMVNSIDRDGTMSGFDVNLIKTVMEAVTVPVIACGGAGRIDDFRKAVKEGGASAVAAGSVFVFQGKHRAVLISYPEQSVLREVLQ
jgi:cyclase